PRLLAETTAALVTESLRCILELSLAGCAPDHGCLHCTTFTTTSPVIPPLPGTITGTVGQSLAVMCVTLCPRLGSPASDSQRATAPSWLTRNRSGCAKKVPALP